MAVRERSAVRDQTSEDMLLTADMADLPVELRPLLTLWEERREAGGYPLRSSLTPRDLKPWLSAIHVYEAVENQRFTARLLGTAIVSAIGADQTGRTFGAQDRDTLATRAYAVLSRVVTEGHPYRTKAARIAAVKQSWHAAESLWLPFGAGGKVQQIMAATVLTTLG